MFRLLRSLVCLLLVFCLILNCSPIKAKATMVTTASVVAVSVLPVVTAVFIGLGVQQAAVAGSVALQPLVESCIAHLQDLGLCQEFTIEVFGLEREAYSLFGITPAVINAIRDWLFDSGTVVEKKETIFTGSGFTYNTDDNSIANAYWRKFPLTSLEPGKVLLTSYSGLFYGITVDSENRVRFCRVSSLLPYTNETFPLGQLVDLNCSLDGKYSLFLDYDSAMNYVLSTGSSAYFIVDDTYFAFSDSYKAAGYHRFYSMGMISTDGTVTYNNTNSFSYSSGSYTYGLYPSEISTETSISVSDGLEAGEIAPQEETLEVGYPNWYNNSLTVQDPTTNELVSVMTIPQISTYQDALGLTQQQIWEGTTTGTNSGTDTDSGTSSDTWNPPENPGAFALDLSQFFPFCIPFDLYDFLTCLNADPVAPVIHWELPLPGGSSYPIEVDLSPFDSVAQLLRRLQLLLFCVGLAIKTRDLIKG